MHPIPELTRLDVAFGNIKHMPKREELPETFQRDWHRDSNPWCKAISKWFFSGAEGAPNGIQIDGVTFTAKPGVDAGKALTAIRAVMGSFEPSHEHKIGGCGFMLSEWFDIEQPKAKAKKRA